MEESNGNERNTLIDLSIHKVIDLIKQSYLNINTDFHNSSLGQLIDLEKNEEEFFMLILTILSEFSKYVTNLEKEIAIYLKNYFKRIEGKAFIINMNHDILKEKCFIVIKCFLEENNIISCLSGYFEEIIDSIFTLMKHINISKQFSEMILINLIKEPLTNYKGQIHLNEIVRLLFILELVFKSYLNFSLEIEKDFDDIFGLYIFLFNKIEGNIIDTIQLVKNSMNNDYSYFNILEQSSLLIYHVINSFIKTSLFSLDYCMKEIFFEIQFESSLYVDNNESKVNKVFLENKQFLTFIYNAIMISYNITNDAIESDKLIMIIIEDENNKGYKKYFNIFNIKLGKIKGTLFELMGEIIKNLSTFEIINKFPKFNEFIRKITNIAIDHLVDVYSQKEYPQDYPFEDRVKMGNYLTSTKLFGYLEKVVSYNFINDVFEKRKNELVKEILIKNLKLNEIEKLCFNDQTSDEYVKNIFDLYHLCKENSLKKKNLKILITLCQNFNCLLDLIIDLSIDILLYCTLNSNNELKEKELEIIYNYLIISFSKVELIELSLLLLTSLSFIISDKPQIHLKIKNIFIQINNILISINDPLLKTKLCLFYAYNLDYLFDLKNDFHLFEQSIQFIFKCTIQNDQNIHLFQIGFNTINSIIFLNHIQPYCYEIVSQYLNPLITYIQTSKMQTYEDDYNIFIKGIIQMYLQNNSNNSHKDSILLFDIFWSFFKEKLSPYLSNTKTSSSNNNTIRQPLRTKPDFTEIINNCQLLKTFLIAFNNKHNLNNEIKHNIYQTVITTLMPIIGNFLNLDFEEDILELLIIVLYSIKSLNENVVNYVKDYLIKMNSGDDGIFNHKFEEYHVNFIFTLVQCFDKEMLVHKKIMFLLFDNIECRLSSFDRKGQIHKIIAEHLIYCDFAFVFVMHFYSKIKNENEINEALNVFITRLKTNPINNNELVQKLCICIILILMKLNTLELLNKVDISIFIKKLIQVYPNKYANRIEHEIIGIGFNIIIRYLLIKEDEMLLKYVKGNFEELVYIKQNSIHKIKENFKNKENENEEMDEEFKHKFAFSKRISHFNNKSCKSTFNTFMMDSFNEEILSKSESSECDINSEEAIDEEHNKENNIQYSNQQYEYIGKENEENENFYSDYDMEINENEMKEDKTECIRNKIEQYYLKFADGELINFINSINQFKLFDLFLKELETNKPVIYSNIIKTIFTESKLKMLNKFRQFQKVPIIKDKSLPENNNNENENSYTYRKILKIKKNK